MITPPTTTPSTNANTAPNVSKNQFIRHELKTELSSIEGYISMLEDGDYGELNLTPDQKEVLVKIKTNLEELTEKIDTLIAD